MTKKEYETKRATLLNEAKAFLADGKGKEATEKMDEVEALDNEYAKAALENANRTALEGQVPARLENLSVNVKGTVVEKMNDNNEVVFDNASPVYRNAFYNALRGVELSDEENRAYAAVNGISLQNAKTTTTEAAALPTQTLNEIWDMCKEQHSILGDIDMRITGVIIDVPKRTAITRGKGKSVAENTANESMEDTKVKVTLSGKDFAATVELSYAAAKMSIDALESFIVKDVADQVGNAMAADVVATIQAGIATGNKLTAISSTEYTYAELCKVLGVLKRCQSIVAYVSNGTLYNYLVSMVDTTGRPLFQTNMQDGARGALLGAVIKQEDAVADGTILVGDPKRVIDNVIQDIMLETDRDIKTHTVVYSAYARAQAALMDDQSFAQISLKANA